MFVQNIINVKWDYNIDNIYQRVVATKVMYVCIFDY